MAREYSLNTEFEVVFDNNLNVVSNVNIGSIPQTSNDTFSIRIKVPTSIININNDSCYLAFVLPTTNKNARLKLPTTLFNDFVLNEDGSYYESVFVITANAVRYVGKVLINLVVRHNTGVQEEQVIGDTELLVDVYTSKSSSTFSLIVTRSSNYSENLYPDEEDEYEEAVDHINAIMDSLSGFASRFIDYKNGIIVVNVLPENIEGFDKTIVFEKSTNNLYLIDTTQESGKVLIANLDLADVADKDFVNEAIRNAIANKLDYETNTDKRVIIKSSNDEGVALVDTINNNRVDVTYDGISISGKVTTGIETHQIVSYEEDLVLNSKANDFSLRSNKNPDILDYDYDDDILNYNGSEVVNKKYVETLEKQIANLKASAEGNTFNYETDDTVAYEKVVPANASPYASLDKVGGMSYVSENLIITDDVEGTKNDITYSFKNGILTLNGSATSTTKITIPLKKQIPVGTYTLKNFNLGQTMKPNDTLAIVKENGWESVIQIAPVNASYYTKEITDVGYYLMYNIPASDNIYDNYKIVPMLVSGSVAPTQFSKGFEGIRDTKITNIKSISENLLALENVEVTTINGIVYSVKDGVITINGTSTSTANILLPTKNLESLKGEIAFGAFTTQKTSNAKYNAMLLISENEAGIAEAILDSLNPYMSTTLNENVKAFGFYIDSGVTFNNFVIKPYIVKGGQPLTEYKPYFEENFKIPTAIQQLDGYGLGVIDNVYSGKRTKYNYIDYDRKVFVQNVYKMKMKDMPWTSQTETDKNGKHHYRIKGRPKDISKYPLISYPVLPSKIYKNTDGNNIYNGLLDKGMAVEGSNFISLYDADYIVQGVSIDLEGFINSLTDDMEIEFCLNTPIETDISHLLTDDNFIEVEPNGTITFENEHNQACGSEITYEVKII